MGKSMVSGEDVPEQTNPLILLFSYGYVSKPWYLA